MADAFVKSVNGITPDAEGDVSLDRTPVLVLNLTQPVPVGTPSGTVIVRTVGAETPPIDPPVDPPTPEFGAVSSSLKLSATAMSSSITLDRPDNLVAGDVIVATFHNSSVGTTFTTPTGWEVLSYLVNDPSLRLTPILTYRVNDPATVPSSWTFTASNNGRMLGATFVVKGAAASGSLVSGSSLPAPNAANYATIRPFQVNSKALLIVVGTSQIVATGAWGLPTAISDSGFTKLSEETNNPSNAGATQSTLSIYTKVVEAGTTPELTLTWANNVSTRSGVAAAIKAAV